MTIFRFGIFEADTQTGELRKQGRRLRLAAQPFQLLTLLLEARGELVTRDSLRERLWPDGTYVDFDHSLNTAVNRIREALGDSAANPRFVETLARRGYRFIAPLEPLEEPAQPPSLASPPPTEPVTKPSLLTTTADLPQKTQKHITTFFLLFQLMYLIFYLSALFNTPRTELALAVFTTRVAPAEVALILTAAIGIAVRLFLLSAAAFRVPRFREKYLTLFPALLILDLIWAASPLLLIRYIDIGLALAALAALLLCAFAQRTLVLMGAGAQLD